MLNRLTPWLPQLPKPLTQSVYALKHLGHKLLLVSLCVFALSSCSVTNKDASYDRNLELAYYDLTQFLGMYYPLASTEFQTTDNPMLSQALQQSGAQVCSNPPCAVGSVLLHSYACRSNSDEQDFILLEIKTPLLTLQRLYQRWTKDGFFVLAGPVSVYSPYDNLQPLPQAEIRPYTSPYAPQNTKTNQGQDDVAPAFAQQSTWQAQEQDQYQAQPQAQPQAQNQGRAQAQTRKSTTPHQAPSKAQDSTKNQSLVKSKPPQEPLPESTGSEDTQTTVLFIPDATVEAIQAEQKVHSQNQPPNKAQAEPQDNVQELKNTQRIQAKPQFIKHDVPLQSAQNKDFTANIESSVSNEQSQILQNRNNHTKINVGALAQEVAAEMQHAVSAQISEVKNSNAPHKAHQAILIEETSMQGNEETQGNAGGDYVNGGAPTVLVEEEEELKTSPKTLVEDLNARIDLYKQEALKQQQQREQALRLEQAAKQAYTSSELQAPAVRDRASGDTKTEEQTTPAPLAQEQKNGEEEPFSSLQMQTVNKQSAADSDQKPSDAQASDRQVRILEQLSEFIDQKFVRDQEAQQPLLFRLKHSTSQNEP